VKLLIFNTSIITCDGTFTSRTITLEEARQLVAESEVTESAVGHPATAALLAELLDIEVPVSRGMYVQQVGQLALVFKLNGRPQGRELKREDLELYGYTLKLMSRTA
jgi:hypothetical protein